MLHSLDVQLFYFLNNLAGQSSWGDALILFCANYLAYLMGALFVGLLVFKAWPKREKLILLFIAGVSTFLARGVITEAIRYFYHRPRPFSVLPVHQLMTDSAWSFPSGHATFFFALSTAVYLYNRRWGVWFFVASVFITLARVAAGVHYPSDIIAGALIGCITAYLSAILTLRYLDKKAH